MNEENIKQLKIDEKSSDDAEESCGTGSGGGWIAGLVLMGIGAIFLLNNLTGFELQNWWALFILIPAFVTLGNAARAFRAEDGFGPEARGSLIGSMILFFISAAFLFGWNWGTIWPVFLIIGGLGALLGARMADK